MRKCNRMKKLILFEGDIETQGYFSEQMKKELLRLGYDVYLYDLKKPWKSTGEMLRFLEKGNTMLLSFNFHGMCQEPQFLDENGTYIWDALDVKCCNILADHPYYYYKLLAQRPRNYCQLSIDKNHEAFMRRFFPEIELGPFLPLGGTQISHPVLKKMPERSMDVVFTGNYASPSRFEKYITRLGDEYTAFYYEMIDSLLADPSQTVEAVVEHFLRREIPQVTEAELKETMQNITFLDLYVRYKTRGEVVKTLVDAGIKVHVFGDKWNELPCERPENLINGDALFSEECLEKIRDSRISLNVLPWFKLGAHDRIYNTMLNGAVCLTDTNPYLDGILRDGENCRLFSLTRKEELPDIVRSLLADPAKMEQITEAGLKTGLQNTWAQRMDQLDPWLRRQ